MGNGRVVLELLDRLEAHVVVAVRRLRGAAGIDEVDLSGDLIERAEPRTAYQRNDVVCIIADERLWVGGAQLLVRVPNPGVGAWLAEMVASRVLLGGLGSR